MIDCRASIRPRQSRPAAQMVSLLSAGLVMKWKTPEQITDRIVEFSLVRAVKGDVFLK